MLIAKDKMGALLAKRIKGLSSLGICGLFSGGIGSLLFYFFPKLFPACSSFETILLASALVGAGICQFIYVSIVNPLIRPMYNSVRYYLDLVQLIKLRRIIGEQVQEELIQKLTRDYFLEDDYKFRSSTHKLK